MVPSTARAARVLTPRPTKACEMTPALMTVVAPITHGRVASHPALCCENPSPLTMNGVNQVRPSDSDQ